jgi:CubicO group peptidase (beta-lactamase class C family)
MKSFCYRKTLLIVFTFMTIFSSCSIIQYYDWNLANQNDYRVFPGNILLKNQHPFFFHSSVNKKSIRLPSSIRVGNGDCGFEKALKESGTLAYLIVKNDTILYEKYFNNYNADSTISSFSVAKSFVSALVGIAINEGLINSTGEPITNYLPELKKSGFEKITIENLLDMQSGISFNERSMSPFGDIARYYYGRNLKKYIRRLQVKQESGKNFEYASVDVQLLGMILENATRKPLYKYLQEKIWTPLGMEYNASWSVDSKENNETKAFCCLNAKARDFAKFGRLYLHEGNWNGSQIVPKEWVNKSTVFDIAKNDFEYSYLWWNNREMRILTDTTKLTGLYKIINVKRNDKMSVKYVAKPGKDFYAEGLLGQFIYIYPEKNIIIVRLGKKRGDVIWPDVFQEIAQNN